MAEKYDCKHFPKVDFCYDKSKYNLVPTDSNNTNIYEHREDSKDYNIGQIYTKDDYIKIVGKPLNANRPRALNDFYIFGKNSSTGHYDIENVTGFNIDGGAEMDWYFCKNCRPNSIKHIENDISGYSPFDERNHLFNVKPNDYEYFEEKALLCQYYPKTKGCTTNVQTKENNDKSTNVNNTEQNKNRFENFEDWE